MADCLPPPHDEYAERAVIAAVMSDQNRYDEVAVTLNDPAKFYVVFHQQVWQAIADLRSENTPVDLVTVVAQLKKRGNIGVSAYRDLAEIRDDTPAVENVKAHAQIVFDKWRLRELLDVCATTAAKIRNEPIADVDQFADDVSTQVEASTRKARAGESCWLKDSLKGTFEKMQEHEQRGGGIIGVSTGFPTLDYSTSGLCRKKLYVLGARSGQGKSVLAINVSMHVASLGQPVLYFSLEMLRDELSKRALCSEAKVSADGLKQGKLLPEAWSRLTDTAARIRNYPVLWDDSTGLTIPRMRAKIGQFKAELERKGKRPFLVVVDHALLMRSTNPRADLRQRMVEVTEGLKATAKDYDVCMLALAQLNRASEARGLKDHRPRISDLKESGSWEQDADQVWLIYRGEKYDKADKSLIGKAEIILAKIRDDGQEGTVEMRFDGPSRRFYEAQSDEYPTTEVA